MGARGSTFRLTLSALLSALSLILLYFSALTPTGRWGMVAAAGLVPAAAVISAGLWSGFGVWGVTALLGFLLVPDRLNVLLYLFLFGLYPMVKSLLERKAGKWLCFLGKLAFFNGVLTLFLLAFAALFLAGLPWEMAGRMYLLYLLGNPIFLIYDYGFSKLIWFYTRRVARRRPG